MAKAREIPELITEFIELAKQYIRQETVEPAKRLGRLAGLGFLAAIVLVLAVLFLAIAGARVVIELLPDGTIWSGLGYVLSAIGLLLITGIVMWRATQ
ncbi:MAG TPA: phage holin family protein [Gemmatimonadales bacterium]|nr:phage holin family protein [Gemmatimonadales bacterium]